MEGLVTFAVLAEQELLEEPGGVGAMLFGRAGVRHRLDELVFGAQGSGPALGLAADSQAGFHQILGEGAGIGEKGRGWCRNLGGGYWFRHGCLRSRERTLVWQTGSCRTVRPR